MMSEHLTSTTASEGAEFTEITPEIAQDQIDLSIVLSAAKEFLESGDQSSSRAEALLFDIDRLQAALSRTVGLEPHRASSIAALTPQLEAIALLKQG
tara:strand:- start:16 stop:306 length:291 start_codon:yes stop_codon:yes gene_type:complete